MLPNFVLAAPVISSSVGTISDKQQITINGSGFGADGPNIAVFDNFNVGVAGNNVSSNATIGTWSSTTSSPKYIADGSNTAVLSIDQSIDSQLIETFAPSTEVFISYAVKIPQGYFFPNTNAIDTYATNSSWKLAWIMDGSLGFHGNDDLVIPTWGNGVWWMIAGNDGQLPVDHMRTGNNSTDVWFDFNGWNRISAYLKGGNNPIVDNGKIYFQALTQNGMKQYTENSYPIFDGKDNAYDDYNYQWTQINFPGWHRGTSEGGLSSNVRVLYDDIYVATGIGAQARVEIGNASTYASSTNLVIATADNWSDSSVSATVRQGSFTNGQQAYLYIIDKDGNVNANGFLATIGSGAADTTSPAAPNGLSVQ